LIVRDQENRDFYNGDIPKENHTNLSDSTVEYTFTLNKDNLVKPFQPGIYTWKIFARYDSETVSAESNFIIKEESNSLYWFFLRQCLSVIIFFGRLI
jgi:hypothetical protein